MKTRDELVVALNAIRDCLDVDVIGCDIDSVNNKLLSLTQLMGLSAEANASAKKLLHLKELEVFESINLDLPASMQSKRLNAECYQEISILQYADRLNAAIVHACDCLRSYISLYKTEIQAGLMQAKQN